MTDALAGATVLAVSWLAVFAGVFVILSDRCPRGRVGLLLLTGGAVWLVAGEVLQPYELAPIWLTDAPWRPLIYRAGLLGALIAFWWGAR